MCVCVCVCVYLFLGDDELRIIQFEQRVLHKCLKAELVIKPSLQTSTQSYKPHNRDWLKQRIVQMLQKQAAI